MGKGRVVGGLSGMKYSWKSHEDRNTHKNRIQRSEGVGKLGWFISDINHNIPITWRWARGDIIRGFSPVLWVDWNITLHALSEGFVCVTENQSITFTVCGGLETIGIRLNGVALYTHVCKLSSFHSNLNTVSTILLPNCLCYRHASVATQQLPLTWPWLGRRRLVVWLASLVSGWGLVGLVQTHRQLLVTWLQRTPPTSRPCSIRPEHQPVCLLRFVPSENRYVQ